MTSLWSWSPWAGWYWPSTWSEGGEMKLDKDSLGGLNGGFSGLDDPPIAGLLRKAVYDAAMARHEAKMRYNELGLTPSEYGQAWADYMNAEQELDRVCRRAKEGR